MIRTAIVGGIRLYREGLAEILSQRPDVQVVSSASDLEESRAQILETQPDVILLDMATPGSYDLAILLTKLAPAARIIALGVDDSEPEVMQCFEAGVAGYVPRSGTLENLIDSIQSAVLGQLRCSPQIAGVLLRRVTALSGGHHQAVPLATLTSREREILELIDQGCSNKEIARRLGIEVATVKNHVHNTLEKLKVHRRGEAAARVRTQSSRKVHE
jgi:DNA-binding NarL/FixJ family response regulator